MNHIIFTGNLGLSAKVLALFHDEMCGIRNEIFSIQIVNVCLALFGCLLAINFGVALINFMYKCFSFIAYYVFYDLYFETNPVSRILVKFEIVNSKPSSN